MAPINEEEIIWFPVDAAYKGRQGDYARSVKTVPPKKLIRLVTMRAIEDGNWSIENGHVGENEDVMRKMMKWVSRPENIIQCADANPDQTVDWVCRELALASQQIAGGETRD